MIAQPPIRSFEQFNYALRPAKNIERKMMCEAFARLSRIQPLTRYRYVGMGSKEFCDFSLIHRQLGVSDMVSIEQCKEERTRFKFNRPYSCIRMRWGTTHEVLPLLKWNRRCIVWLDYEGWLDDSILGDVRTLVGCLRSGSVFVITVKVKPGELNPEEPDPRQRYDELVIRVGKGRVPPKVTGVTLAKWGLADASAMITHNEIEQAIRNRNGKLKDVDRLSYVPLFNIHYADGAQMASFGGLLVNAMDHARLNETHFADLPFISGDDSPYLIESPVLTHREIRLLDTGLPAALPNMNRPAWMPLAERRKYGKVYRYFPSFSEVET